MKTTLLDDYIKLCLDMQERVPVCRHMIQVIQETRPLAYLWRDATPDPDGLPPTAIEWDDPAFLLWSPAGILPGRHRFVVDLDSRSDDPDFRSWFRHNWSADGLMVFTRPGYERFDVIPIATHTGGPLLLADAQISFELTPGGWSWQYATVGPNNWFFHNWFMQRMDADELEQVNTNVDLLANGILKYLGGYYKDLLLPGEWFVKPLRPHKVKTNKKGEVKKIIKPGTLGYKEYRINGDC